MAEPVITAKARELNFTNEGGVCGTVRVLKNIAGLWLLQSCRRCWNQEVSYDDLLIAAADQRYEFQSLFDPDAATFLHPENMVTAIADYCQNYRPTRSRRSAGIHASDSGEPGAQVSVGAGISGGDHRNAVP